MPSLTRTDAAITHDHLLNFWKSCKELYKTPEITPNMHLHGYLLETALNGPAFGYWLFGFERYNGLLKNVQTNKKEQFESTFLRRFLCDNQGADILRVHLVLEKPLPTWSHLRSLHKCHRFRLYSFPRSIWRPDTNIIQGFRAVTAIYISTKHWYRGLYGQRPLQVPGRLL